MADGKLKCHLCRRMVYLPESLSETEECAICFETLPMRKFIGCDHGACDDCSAKMLINANEKRQTNQGIHDQGSLGRVISELRQRDQNNPGRIIVAIETLPPHLHGAYRDQYESHLRRHARQIIEGWERHRGADDSESESSEFEFSPQEDTRREPHWFIQNFVPCLSFLFI